MSPEQVGFALLYLGIFLLLGKWIRLHSKGMQNLFLPASVIGGFRPLLGPEILGRIIAILPERMLFWPMEL